MYLCSHFFIALSTMLNNLIRSKPILYEKRSRKKKDQTNIVVYNKLMTIILIHLMTRIWSLFVTIDFVGTLE